MHDSQIHAVLPVVVRERHTEYVDRNITINRAPTDESVKLLREMEEKAEAEVIQAVRVGDTVFECVVQRRFDAMSDQTLWRAVFKLNGKTMTAESATNGREHPDEGSLLRAWGALRENMAKTIAGEVLTEAFIRTTQPRGL